jgi:hypothetical protein
MKSMPIIYESVCIHCDGPIYGRRKGVWFHFHNQHKFCVEPKKPIEESEYNKLTRAEPNHIE